MEYKEINPKESEVEIAFQILKTTGQSKDFRELMQNVSEIKGSLADPKLMAYVHSLLNFDNRFNFLGQGKWGLKEWTMEKGVRRISKPMNSHRFIFQPKAAVGELEINSDYDNDEVSVEDEESWNE